MQSDYTNVDAASDRIAYLQRDGFDLAKLELLRIESPSVTSEPDYRPVTEDDWQSWLDTIAAAPRMREFCTAMRAAVDAGVVTLPRPLDAMLRNFYFPA